jgi:hypothetical protein
MSALSPLSGVKRKSGLRAVRSVVDPKRTSTTLRDFARKAPSAPSGTLLARASFDHLVGQREQRGRHGEAERIRGLTINDEVELCRQLDG